MFDRMIERLSFGWSMARSSWTVVKGEPKLLVLPLISGVFLAALVASFFVPSGIAARFAEPGLELGANAQTYALAAWLALYYFVVWFVMIFLNAALVFSVLRYFETGKVSLREGLSMATMRLPQIAGWALLGATVGVLLNVVTNALKDKLGFLGALLGGLLETAWAVVTYFVTPVLVVEGLGPIKAVRRSAEILRRSWGEQLGGEGGLGLIGFLLMLPVLLAAGFGVLSGMDPAGALPLMLALGAYVLAVVVLLAALSTVLRSALYIYATTGNPPKCFEAGALSSAFRPR